jgi:hypothetical protein
MDPKKQSLPVLFWDGDENPRRLIENILPLVSRFSNVPEEKLKELISTAVVTALKGKYTDSEFTTEFDDNGIIHLKNDNYDFLSVLSSGDRIVLWVSLLAAISKSAAINMRFILNQPFYRIDSRKRIAIEDILRDDIVNARVIRIDSNRDFDLIVDLFSSCSSVKSLH